MTESTDDNGNIDTLIFLEQTDKIRQEQIVASYVFNPKIRSLVLSLNHKYEGMVITMPVDPNWPKTIKIFAKELKRKNVTEDHITMICDVADNNAVKILKHVQEEEENKLQETSKQKNKKKYYIQKYRGDNFLAEAVLVDGKPFFALTNANNDNITLCESVEDMMLSSCHLNVSPI